MRERSVSRVREQRLRRGGLFIPLVFALAADIEGMPVEELLASPTKLTNGLRTMFGYFGVDGVAAWCDDTAPAAAFGCSRQWSTYPPGGGGAPPPGGSPRSDADVASGEAIAIVADVVRRLGTLLPDTVLVGTMPGPVTLAGQLAGAPSEAVEDPELLRAAAKACLAYAKLLGDAGLDVLLMREQALLGPGSVLPTADVARLYSPIWNMARFYGLAALLVPPAPGGATAGSEAAAVVTADLDAALATVGGVVDGVVLPAESPPAAAAGFKRVGLALPPRLLDEPAEAIAVYLEATAVGARIREGSVFLLTTDGEVLPKTGRKTLIAGINTIRDLIRGGLARG